MTVSDGFVNFHPFCGTQCCTDISDNHALMPPNTSFSWLPFTRIASAITYNISCRKPKEWHPLKHSIILPTHTCTHTHTHLQTQTITALYIITHINNKYQHMCSLLMTTISCIQIRNSYNMKAGFRLKPSISHIYC